MELSKYLYCFAGLLLAGGVTGRGYAKENSTAPSESFPSLPISSSWNTCLKNDGSNAEVLVLTSDYFQDGFCVDPQGEKNSCTSFLSPKESQDLNVASGDAYLDYNVCKDSRCVEYLGHFEYQYNSNEAKIINRSGLEGKEVSLIQDDNCFSVKITDSSVPTAAPVPSLKPTVASLGPTRAPTTPSPTMQKTAAPTHSGENGAATEVTLKIAGVSINVWEAPDGTELVVPVGNSLSGLEYTPSEAWGYAMRNAVEAKDKDFFFSLLTSYLYYSNQSSSLRNAQRLPLCEGLMGWSPYLDPSKGGFPSESYYFSSASDADMDILAALLRGFDQFGDMTVQDTVTPKEPGVVQSSISLKDLIILAGKSFVDYDLGTVTYPGSSEASYMLTNDNWGHDLVNADYFDPVLFYNLEQFFQKNGVSQSYQDKLSSAAQNTMVAIYNYAKGSNGWIGDTPYEYPAKSNNFGYDAVRMLMRFGEFLATPEAVTSLGPDFYKQCQTVLADLVNNINPLCEQESGGTYRYQGGSGLSQAQFTGPLSMALQGLKASGVESIAVKGGGTQPIDSVIETVETCLANDMKNYDTTHGMSGWQPYYFSMQLGLLDEQLIDRLGSSLSTWKKISGISAKIIGQGKEFTAGPRFRGSVVKV